MTPNHTTTGGNKHYRYYVCTAAQIRGCHTCPSMSIPAKKIEDFVIEQIKKIGCSPELIQDVVTSVADKMKGQLKQLEDERLAIGRDTVRWNSEVRKTTALMRPNEADSPAIAKLADLQERLTHKSSSSNLTTTAKQAASRSGQATGWRPEAGGSSGWIYSDLPPPVCSQKRIGKHIELVEGPPPKTPDRCKGRIPRITCYLALAIYYEDLIRHIHDYAEIALLGHITRARVTQIKNLRGCYPLAFRNNFLVFNGRECQGLRDF